MYNPLPKSLTIRQSNIQGLGLFATEFIPANSDLGMTHLYDERFPDNYVRMPLGGFFNHSNEPNCKAVHEDFPYKHIHLVTLIDIQPGDELTAYYTLYVPEPLPTEPEYELRGYGLLPYNIKPVQAGIQYSHSIVEYVVDNYDTPAFKLFLKWAKKFKTAVLLDGGTSNHSKPRYSDEEYVGTMEQHAQALKDNGILFSEFYEPDLNDMLAGIFLIADERVFNKRKYPDFGFTYDSVNNKFVEDCWMSYESWVENVGGEKNVFLRNYIGKLPLWR
jgi:hypothetical protein